MKNRTTQFLSSKMLARPDRARSAMPARHEGIEGEILELERRRAQLLKLALLRDEVLALELGKMPGTDSQAVFRVVAAAVCGAFGIKLSVIMARGRTEAVARTRQVIFYMMRDMTPISLAEIGRLFDKDHGTVSHGIAAVKDKMDVDARFRERVIRLVADCRQTVSGLNVAKPEVPA